MYHVKPYWVILNQSHFNRYCLQLYTVQKCIFTIILNSQIHIQIFSCNINVLQVNVLIKFKMILNIIINRSFDRLMGS